MKKEATAKVIIPIITTRKVVIRAVVMMKLTSTDLIMKVVKDRRVENMVIKRDTKKARKLPATTINPAKMTIIKSINSTMMLTKKETTTSMEVIMLITHPKEEKAKKEVITNLDTKGTVLVKRVTPAKDIMMMIIKDIRDIMDMKGNQKNTDSSINFDFHFCFLRK